MHADVLLLDLTSCDKKLGIGVGTGVGAAGTSLPSNNFVGRGGGQE